MGKIGKKGIINLQKHIYKIFTGFKLDLSLSAHFLMTKSAF